MRGVVWNRWPCDSGVASPPRPRPPPFQSFHTLASPLLPTHHHRLQDLGLETPNWYGYNDYGKMVEVMDTYVQGVEDTSGEVVVKVPPKPPKEVPPGLEEVTAYLYSASCGTVQ